MCDPLTIAAATAALSVGQTVMTHIGTNQAFQANKRAAHLDYANRFNVTEQQRQQLDAERSEKAFDTAIASIQSEGRISASASDLGLSSGNILSTINADMFGLGRQDSIDALNDQNARNQISNERRGAEIARNSKIASAPRSSGLALVLGVGKGVLEGAGAYKSAGGRF